MMSEIDFDELDILNIEQPKVGEQIQHINTKHLQRSIHQPRRTISQEGLENLAESIREQGVIQPIIVRSLNETKYEIIAGERRWQASKIAKRVTVPCIVRRLNDIQARAISLIENIDREDMDVWDEIAGISALAKDIGSTETAKILGKKDSKKKKGFVSKCLRISESPDIILDFLRSGYSSDVDAFYNLALLAEENIHEAEAIINRWHSDPSIRFSLRKQIEKSRKKQQPITQPNLIENHEKQQMMDQLDADLEVFYPVDPPISHAKPEEIIEKILPEKKPLEIEEPPMILKAASYKNQNLILQTNEGELVISVDKTAKNLLKKVLAFND